MARVAAYFPYIGLALVTIAYGVAYYFSNRSFQSMLTAAHEENVALLDRLFVRNHLPPSGIDLTEDVRDRKKMREIAVAGSPPGNGNSFATPAIGGTLAMERTLKAQAEAAERSGTIA